VRLIQSAVARTDWDLDLQVPQGITALATEEGGRPTIN
jgi:hypothetical protein